MLSRYDYTYYPDKIINSGKAVYVKRNQEMIDRSAFCIVYYDENYVNVRNKEKKKSGTKIAIDYALKKNVTVKKVN